MVRRARHHEQQIGQPVEIHDDNRLDGLGAERDDPALGAAADGARLVQQRSGGRPPGRMNRRSGGSSRFERVDQLLEPLDVPVRTAAFVTRSAIRDRGSASRAPMAKSSF